MQQVVVDTDFIASKGVVDIIRGGLSYKVLEGFGSLGKHLEASQSF